MLIEKLQIRNFKSIADTGALSFDPNFVVLSGKNNAGKTALLEALYKCFKGTVQHHNVQGGASHSEGIYQPSPALFEIWIKLNTEEQEKLFGTFIAKERWQDRILISLKSNNGQTHVNLITLFKPDSDVEDVSCWFNPTNANYIGHYVAPTGGRIDLATDVFGFMSHVCAKIAESIIFITGNRVVQPIHQSDIQTHLNTNASNLHAVLYALHNNSEDIFDEIERNFVDIFPDVKRLQTRVVNNNGTTNCHVEFHDGLKVPLQECGTGLTHVLVMLCVAYSETNRIVLFDEPHSFLHPSAEKSIYDLASREDHHQFIFTTHSPILLNYPVEKTVYLVQKVDGKSVYRNVNAVEDVLADVGFVNSDLTLSDFILFVEGDTEELLLKPLFQAFELVPFGKLCNVVSLGGSGRIAMKSSEMRRNAELMEKVLSATSKLQIPYHIILDRDERDQATMERINAYYEDHISIIPKREIENYLLNSCAISVVITACGAETDGSKVELYMAEFLEMTEDRQLYPRKCLTGNMIDVKGSTVLTRIFAKYDLNYDKKRHGKMLIDHILSSDKHFLDELVGILKGIF